MAGGHHLVKGVEEALETLAGDIRERANRGVGQESAGQQPPQVLDDRLAALRLDQVDFRQRHHSMAQAHQRQNVQVLVRLRHDAVVGGHDKYDHVQAMGARHHVADEIHMSGHVHNAHDPLVGQPAGGEAQVNGQAALFLLGQGVGFAAGEQFDQGRFAVVHVACRAEHDVLA